MQFIKDNELEILKVLFIYFNINQYRKKLWKRVENGTKSSKKPPPSHKYAIVYASQTERYEIQKKEVTWWLVCWQTIDSESGKKIIYVLYFSAYICEYISSSSEINSLSTNHSLQAEISDLFQSGLFLFYATGQFVENWRDSEQIYHNVIPVWESESEQLFPPSCLSFIK